MRNKLVIIGNGFDLAHGLKTTYKDFLDWYVCKAFHCYREHKNYTDVLIEFRNLCTGFEVCQKNEEPQDYNQALSFMRNENRVSKFKSTFFKKLLEDFSKNNWVDIERNYFETLKKSIFSSTTLPRKTRVQALNSEFSFITEKLSEYILEVNNNISTEPLPFQTSRSQMRKLFSGEAESPTIFLNFNYTDTITPKHYAEQSDVIHIHGRASDKERNPIIFGYGDESDAEYQKIEDLSENSYLDHFKSFGYFRTQNYRKLLLYIDSGKFDVAIVCHSCGLSDRVLLSEIFEHENCQQIEIFFHVRKDGSDNFKETTQEISRHFKPQNKSLMRRKVQLKDSGNIIPQTS